MLRNQIEDGSRALADPEQVVSAMYGDIQAAAKLLAELREAYRRLPQHIQVHIACLLRESTPQNTTRQ
jgi:hypothetical protein